MTNSLCPHCGNDLHHRTLVKTVEFYVDGLAPEGFPISHLYREYACPDCDGRITVTQGRIIAVGTVKKAGE